MRQMLDCISAWKMTTYHAKCIIRFGNNKTLIVVKHTSLAQFISSTYLQLCIGHACNDKLSVYVEHLL